MALVLLCLQLPSLATNTLAEAYRDQAARCYAQGLLQKSNDLYEKAYKQTDPLVGGAKITLEQAAILSEWGQVENKLAEEYAEKAKSDVDTKWSEEAEKQRDYAKEHLELALGNQERMLGINNATCARTLDTLAELHLDSKDFALAESIFRKAIKIRQANFGTGTQEIGYEYWKLATIAYNDTRYQEASQQCRTAIPLLAKYGPNNPALMQCKLTLAEALYKLGKLSDAAALATESMSYWKKKKGPQYSLTTQSQQLMNDINNEKADSAQAQLRKQIEKLKPNDPRLVPYIENWRITSAKAGRQDDVQSAQNWLAGTNSAVRSTAKHRHR